MFFFEIYHIACKEAKITCRSTPFRIFSVVILALVLYTHIREQGTTAQWAQVALPSSVPYLNTLLFQLLQTILVILLASEFHIKERRADTLEVLRVYPVSNFAYYTGKIGGVVVVLLFLNLLSLLMGACFNLFVSPSPFSLYPYLFYFFTLSLPTIICFTGIAFLVATIVRNRVLSIILLPLVASCFCSLLPRVCYGTFDLYALYVDTTLSEVTGHSDLLTYLLQRSLFLCVGLSCMGFTAATQSRLNNRNNDKRRYVFGGTICFAVGICTSLFYYHQYRTDDQIREKYRATYTKYLHVNVVLKEQDIHYRQEGEILSVKTMITLENPGTTPVDTCVLYLNPALEVHAISNDGEQVPFRRENQAVIVVFFLNPGESRQLEVTYSGKIDERICYLYISDSQRQEIPSLFDRGRRYAFLEDRYTLLTPECLWYPVAIPPGIYPESLLVPLVSFRLKVDKTTQKTILSQGVRRERVDDITFTPACPLSWISLCIGDFNKKSSITISSRDYTLYTLKGHRAVGRVLRGVTQDTIRELYAEMKMFQSDPLPSAFDELQLIEVPATFRSYYRVWESKSEYLQPGVFFWQEEGLSYDCQFYGRNNEERVRYLIWDTWREGRLIISDPFAALFGYGGHVSVNPYNSRFLYFNTPYRIYSESYPIIDQIWHSIQCTQQGNKGAWGSSSLRYLSEYSFDQALRDKEIQAGTLYSIKDIKSEQLLRYIHARSLQKEFDRFSDYLNQRYANQSIPYELFLLKLQAYTGVDLSLFMDKWLFQNSGLPEYQIKDFAWGRKQEGEDMLYLIRFKIHNNSYVEGNIAVRNSDILNYYMIPPCSYKEIVMEVSSNYTYILYGMSKNIPVSSSYECYARYPHSLPFFDDDVEEGIFDIDSATFYQVNENEIIIDNRDSGFRVVDIGAPSWLLRSVGKVTKNDIEKPRPTFNKWQEQASINAYGYPIQSLWERFSGAGKTYVEWITTITKAGRYDLYVYKARSERGFSSIYTKEAAPFHYSIHNSGTTEEVQYIYHPYQGGEHTDWGHIGRFHLQPGETSVRLSDKSSAPNLLIIADAIKWVYIPEK